MLKGNDFVVKTARSGEEALEKAAKSLPDLLLLDIEMPGIDGFETCRRFKKNKKLSRIPILFLETLDVDQSDQSNLLRGSCPAHRRRLFEPCLFRTQ